MDNKDNQVIQKYAAIIRKSEEIEEKAAEIIKETAINAIGEKLGIMEANVVMEGKPQAGYMLTRAGKNGMVFYQSREEAVEEYLKSVGLYGATVRKTTDNTQEKIPLKNLIRRNEKTPSQKDKLEEPSEPIQEQQNKPVTEIKPKIDLAALTKGMKQEDPKPVKEQEDRKETLKTSEVQEQGKPVSQKQEEPDKTHDEAEPAKDSDVPVAEEIQKKEADKAPEKSENKYTYTNARDFMKFLEKSKTKEPVKDETPEEKTKEVVAIEQEKEQEREQSAQEHLEITPQQPQKQQTEQVSEVKQQREHKENTSQYIMHRHDMKFVGRTDKTYIREFEIKVSPLSLPDVTQNGSVPVIAVLKAGKELVTAISEKERVSCQMSTKDGITFMVRGIWRDGQFMSKVYPTGAKLHEKYEVREEITKVEPDFAEPEKYKATFFQKIAGQDTELAVYPLQAYNEPSGLVPVLVAVLREDSNDSAISGRDCTVIVESDNSKYRAYGKWEDDRFVKVIEKI